MMTRRLWIDGDACPKLIKNIIFKAAVRTKTACMIVANHFSQIPPSPYIKRQVVEQGFDSADKAIEDAIDANDVVITADLPLAEACLIKKAYALSPRGELFDLGSIKQKLAMRDFNETMRSSGIHSQGPSALGEKDIRQFANALDRLLAKN